ncbi:MAG: tRNA (N6-isopentenyl adenosine(37)-C2)-methylthiotransferase MiaB [Bacteroidales bacterium]|nr:tRNA (N6-isopentenyl adenosine(37)-C2)-methylthiotransferase MiaB [Bacteroidales bacterium]MBN2756829.1 tRNA (N6-isopentenyl adenosine(37)-C2)-methylthiotransferase MiaB [Bacteroidales bacterium]
MQKIVVDKIEEQKNDLSKKFNKAKQKLYIETYGCQMNVADSELVVSILNKEGFAYTENIEDADLILINTCSIRENAEKRIFNRLEQLKHLKKKNKSMLIGIIGCMAERLKEKLLEEEKLVDIVVGPDAYRDLPKLVKSAESGQQAINVLLSREETYAEISPIRLDKNGVSAYVSIMRGCDNMCAYCVVPFTRGRERSRDPKSILNEVNELIEQNYKEVTLLGQNVDKYNWNSGEVNFANLLEMTAKLNSKLRVRFSTSYPQDMTDEVIKTIAKFGNICNYIHLPVQSGSTRILDLMKRGYTRDWYMNRISTIKKYIPDCAISSDFITGFCTETEEDHKDTLSIMEWVGFDYAYMFKYSERPNTYAAKKLEDDIPEEIKSRRLNEIIELQHQLSLESNKKDIGKTFEVLVEGVSKKSENRLYGRSPQYKIVVFERKNYNIGDFVNVKVTDCTSATLKGESI